MLAVLHDFRSIRIHKIPKVQLFVISQTNTFSTDTWNKIKMGLLSVFVMTSPCMSSYTCLWNADCTYKWKMWWTGTNNFLYLHSIQHLKRSSSKNQDTENQDQILYYMWIAHRASILAVPKFSERCVTFKLIINI